MVTRFKRPARPSFAGLPCQYRKAALVLKKLMQRKPLPLHIAARNAAVSPTFHSFASVLAMLQASASFCTSRQVP
jgi:hypothetical protein